LVAKNATPINIANALPRLVDAVAVLAPRVGRAHGAQLAFPTESAAEKDETKNDHQKTFVQSARHGIAAVAAQQQQPPKPRARPKSWEMRSWWEFSFFVIATFQ
jgi:hypothetical protein